jgi:hypothetical protein
VVLAAATRSDRVVRLRRKAARSSSRADGVQTAGPVTLVEFVPVEFVPVEFVPVEFVPGVLT